MILLTHYFLLLLLFSDMISKEVATRDQTRPTPESCMDGNMAIASKAVLLKLDQLTCLLAYRDVRSIRASLSNSHRSISSLDKQPL